jgi:hypothetical protein
MIDVIRPLIQKKESVLRARLFFVRHDGISIYDSAQDSSTQAVGALSGGLWQAAEALMKMIDASSGPMEFRLGFDTSSQGVMIVPVQFQGGLYFLGAIYHESLNPALLKRQVIQLQDEITKKLLTIKTIKRAAPKITAARAGYLFDHITDEEMDRLFSLGGN